ncbi:MAG TPA: hypothetical protein VI029_07695 [Mycobacterium sp.]
MRKLGADDQVVAATRRETLRRPEVSAVVEAIRARMREQQDVLLGGGRTWANPLRGNGSPGAV